jgi:hydrogenase maturation protease
MPAKRTLVIAWGNPDRRDDGAGWAVAEALRLRPEGAAAEVVCVVQLAPELAEDLAQAGRALFVDAHVDAGDDVRLRRLEPAASMQGAISHDLPPDRLLGLARSLYGCGPEAWLLTVRAHDLSFGTEMSPETATLAARATDRAAEWLRGPCP